MGFLSLAKRWGANKIGADNMRTGAALVRAQYDRAFAPNDFSPRNHFNNVTEADFADVIGHALATGGTGLTIECDDPDLFDRLSRRAFAAGLTVNGIAPLHGADAAPDEAARRFARMMAAAQIDDAELQRRATRANLSVAFNLAMVVGATGYGLWQLAHMRYLLDFVPAIAGFAFAIMAVVMALRTLVYAWQLRTRRLVTARQALTEMFQRAEG